MSQAELGLAKTEIIRVFSKRVAKHWARQPKAELEMLGGAEGAGGGWRHVARLT